MLGLFFVTSRMLRLFLVFLLFIFFTPVFCDNSYISLPNTNNIGIYTNKTISQISPVATVIKPSLSIPAPPDFDAKGYILIDANSGYVIAEKNADQHLQPASLTKVMSLYVVADALKSGRIHLGDSVLVSEKAWRTGGSRMFIRVGTEVSVNDLIYGIATVSGNDASIAMAEHVAGSESGFVDLMNQVAKNLGMNNTNFSDSNGLPNANHYSSARDLAILSSRWILDFPEYYSWFKEKWFTYNKIRQPNRNRLLWRDSSIDGIKTGHTNEAGYCLISSAMRNNGMRLISVILGARNDAARAKYTEQLLNYGYHFFETRKILSANSQIIAPRIWFGKKRTSVFGLKNDMYVTFPIGQGDGLKVSAEVNKNIKAPVVKGQSYGVCNVILNGKIISSSPLIALQDNPRCNFLFSLYDYFIMLFRH